MLKKTLLISVLFLFAQISYAFKYNGITIDENESFERIKTGDTPSSLKEISGMACSRTSKGYFWVHVDDGNSEIYALNPNGSIKQTVKLGGIPKNDDWEDICMATVDGNNYVLVGCIGDNKVKDGDDKGKQKYYIYRFKEPVITGETTTITSSEIETITFTYDGLHNQNDCKDKVSHNAETLMFDPVKKKIYVATKHKKEINALYTIEWRTGSYTTVMNWECDLGQSGDKFLSLTAGDISSDGQKVLIKNASDILYWLREGEEDLSSTFNRQPQHIKAYKEEKQGEAVAWDNNNRDFYTTGEGKSVPVYTYLNTDSSTGFNRPETESFPIRISGNCLFADSPKQEAISLYSLSGQKIRSSASNTVDVTGLKGIYIVKIKEWAKKICL